jgi:hypothetical protein
MHLRVLQIRNIACFRAKDSLPANEVHCAATIGQRIHTTSDSLTQTEPHTTSSVKHLQNSFPQAAVLLQVEQ